MSGWTFLELTFHSGKTALQHETKLAQGSSERLKIQKTLKETVQINTKRIIADII